MSASVRIDVRGPIAHVAIDRASIHNAFDDTLIAELGGKPVPYPTDDLFENGD